METVDFSLVCQEDLDIGTGTKQVRLADGGLYTLHQISLPSFLVLRTVSISPLDLGASAVAPGALAAGMRVAAVTTKNTVAFGTSRGLTSFAIGDANIIDRWGVQTDLTLNATTGQRDFTLDNWPIYPSNTDLLISAQGGTFNGVGRLEVTIWYFYLTHRSA